MSGAGTALLGIGMGHGEHRAVDAAMAAVSSPLLETSMDGARSILLSITGGATSRCGRSTRRRRRSARRRTPTPTSSSARWSTRTSRDQVWVTVVATGYGERPTQRPRRLDEPIGEPRIQRTSPPRPVTAGRAPLSVASSLDVPEFVPRH